MLNTEVVLKNIAMANKLASQYASQKPACYDDILSAAYWGLIKAAQLSRRNRRQANNSYVARTIKGEIEHSFHAGGSLTRSERLFLARYLDQTGNMADRADALGLSQEYVFRRLANMTFVFPLYNYSIQLAEEPAGDLEELLEVCLSYLPSRLHWTFLCRYRDQMNYSEIASRLGLHRHAVRKRLRRAIAILRENKQEISELVF